MILREESVQIAMASEAKERFEKEGFAEIFTVWLKVKDNSMDISVECNPKFPNKEIVSRKIVEIISEQMGQLVEKATKEPLN